LNAVFWHLVKLASTFEVRRKSSRNPLNRIIRHCDKLAGALVPSGDGFGFGAIVGIWSCRVATGFYAVDAPTTSFAFNLCRPTTKRARQ
jgi:hypothetical protein